jgi:ElaB/YqjD/DUF883 family membrane-anchored ribosome-binding protein
MDNQPNKSQFPKTAEDVEELKQTAGEAASDLSDVATKHASRASKQIKKLAGDAKEEGRQQLEQVKGSLEDVVAAARDYFNARPALCLGIAFALEPFSPAEAVQTNSLGRNP